MTKLIYVGEATIIKFTWLFISYNLIIIICCCQNTANTMILWIFFTRMFISCDLVIFLFFWPKFNFNRLRQNQDNVSEWGNISIRGLLFQWASTIKIQLSVLIWYKADLIIISLKINLFSPWYSWKIAELALKNNHSLTQNL
jgi:hypothetical protein